MRKNLAVAASWWWALSAGIFGCTATRDDTAPPEPPPAALTTPPVTPAPAPTFLDYCKQPDSDGVEKAVKALKAIAGKDDCDDAYQVLSQLEAIGSMAPLIALPAGDLGADFRPLASLTGLKSLTLFLGGSCQHLEALASLTALREFNAYLSPSATSLDLGFLARLPLLETLYLQEGKGLDLSFLASLASLRTLTLSLMSGTHINDVFGLQSLEALKIQWSNDLDLTGLSRLTKLKELQIHRGYGAGAFDLAVLDPLGELRSLRLWDGEVTHFERIASHEALESLSLDGLRGDLRLDGLSALPALRTLALRNLAASLDLAPLAQGAPPLTNLELSHVSVRSVVALAGLKTLKGLSINMTTFPIDEGVDFKQILAGFERLTNLELAYVDAKPGLPALPALKNLTAVSPTADGFVLPDLDFLAQSPGLEKLYVYGSPVASLDPLAPATNLIELNISRTGVASLAPLAGATHLARLTLNSTPVTSLAPLAALTALTTLSLQDTPVYEVTDSRPETCPFGAGVNPAVTFACDHRGPSGCRCDVQRNRHVSLVRECTVAGAFKSEFVRGYGNFGDKECKAALNEPRCGCPAES